MIPPAGVWCLECLDAKGHRCQAQMYEGPRPLCWPCADGDPCSVDRVGAPAAPAEFSEGILEPDREPAPVIQRTPEELGLARVVIEPAAPESGAKLDGPKARAEARRLIAAVEQRGKHGSRVLAPEREKPVRKTFSEDRLRAALADLKTMTWREVSEKHGISPPTLSKYRRQMGGAGPATARQSRKTALALKPGQQAVHIDTTGPAAIDGLAGLGVVRIRIERELSIEQARGMLARLTPEQLGVALSAALTAGLEG